MRPLISAAALAASAMLPATANTGSTASITAISAPAGTPCTRAVKNIFINPGGFFYITFKNIGGSVNKSTATATSYELNVLQSLAMTAHSSNRQITVWYDDVSYDCTTAISTSNFTGISLLNY